MDAPTPLTRTTRLLGYAGLLPPAAGVALAATGRGDIGYVITITYTSVIVSFLGRIWWGFAMQRRERQGILAAVSVVPSLAVFAILFLSGPARYASCAIALGVLAMLTLPVDRMLERDGDAPTGWFRFRLVLSSLLGLLTITVGLLAPS